MFLIYSVVGLQDSWQKGNTRHNGTGIWLSWKAAGIEQIFEIEGKRRITWTSSMCLLASSLIFYLYENLHMTAQWWSQHRLLWWSPSSLTSSPPETKNFRVPCSYPAFSIFSNTWRNLPIARSIEIYPSRPNGGCQGRIQKSGKGLSRVPGLMYETEPKYFLCY